MKSYTDALTGLADIQYEIGLTACKERKALRKEVDDIKVVLLGDGQPEKSLVSRVGALERCIEDDSTSIKNIEKALLGSDEGAGLYEKMRGIEKMRNSINSVMWIMIGTVVGQVILLLIRLIGN